MDYFEIPYLELQDASLKRRSSSAASVVDDGEASLAAAAGAVGRVDDGGDWYLEGVVSSNDVERVVANQRVCDFQDSCRAKKCKDPRTVVEAFSLAKELVSEEDSLDAGPLTDLVSMESALAAA